MTLSEGRDRTDYASIGVPCGAASVAVPRKRNQENQFVGNGALHGGDMAGVTQLARDHALRDVLTRQQVAEWLQVRPRQVERLGVPCLNLGRKTKRYRREDVLAWLEAQRRLDRLVA